MFFADKDLINAGTTKAGQLQSVHAVRGFFKNYTLDVLRHSSTEIAIDLWHIERTSNLAGWGAAEILDSLYSPAQPILARQVDGS